MNVYLFSDLDRTILPNGLQPESPLARPLLHKLAAQKWLKLIYVSGRGIDLLRQAIQEFDIPVPDFAIGDVGTTMYRIIADDWQSEESWQKEIGQSWQAHGCLEAESVLSDCSFLTKQELEKQGRYKLSYYLPSALLAHGRSEVEKRLTTHGIKASVVTSLDETVDIGLLDVLPLSATKLDAVQFLLRHYGVFPEQAVYSGDSGNDMPVLVSDLQAVLVANALPQVKEEAIALARQAGTVDTLYIAEGFSGLNGNYSAGVLEGAAHYFPKVAQWLAENSTFPSGASR